jgi:raffinose/stachyose/melibiose transport system permease protein
MRGHGIWEYFLRHKLLNDKVAIAVFVLPGLLMYSVIVFVPTVWSIWYSFFTGMVGLNFTFNGGRNYLRMFSDAQFLDSFVKTLRYVSMMVVGEVGLATLIALMLGFFVRKFSALARTVVFLPVVLPIVAVAQLFARIYDVVPFYGLLNSFLDLVGLDAWIRPWIGIPSTAMYALVVQDVWKGMGLYALIIYAALVNIPREVLESARIDGANGFKLVWRIVLPLLRPIMVTCAILSLSGTLKVYASPLALTNGGPGKATHMLSLYMYDTAFKFGNYGYGSTLAVFILFECLVITILVKGLFDRRRDLE